MSLTRLRLLLLLTGLGALFTGVPVSALVAPGPDGPVTPVASRSVAAIELLENAARVARTRAWSGTQHVVSTRSGEAHFTVLQIRHVPGAGSEVHVLYAQDQTVAAADVLDRKLLVLLAKNYELRIVGDRICSGRRTELIEAVRPGTRGIGSLAGRFWVDRETGLVVRRDVLDTDGAVVRTSSFVRLQLTAGDVMAQTAEVVKPSGDRLDEADLAALRTEGWPVPSTLPSGMELFEARLHSSVLQLSFSDGLSTLSLFVQRGRLPRSVSGDERPVAGGTVWVSSGLTERMVWSGEGNTWTLVSDAPDEAVEDAVLVLPHTTKASAGDGMLSRAWRGMSRVGAWLNPFT
ncbi:MAG: putative sigma regulatory protein MucB/RseB [Frankiales bacterium]|nr:putative sigma regulatory protein MucB/RseB [Frankiales bacterium]